MDTETNLFQKLNAPLQFIDRIDDVELWIKREDLIHHKVSGNKWRKLKYYIEDFKKSDKTTILSFGGAFSNHLVALASVGMLLNIATKAIVRGEEVDNDSLQFCESLGMQILRVSREEYALRNEIDYLKKTQLKFSDSYIIPEGGKGKYGILGCTEILEEIDSTFFDYICCSGGTGTTFTGLLYSGYNTSFVVYPALKGGRFLAQDIKDEIEENRSFFLTKELGKDIDAARFLLQEDYHFGGFGKVNSQLIDFMNSFYQDHDIPLDPVYTGKMFFGICKDIKNGFYKKGSKILAIHTGGLQGIRGMNEFLKRKKKTLINYETL